jgi:hypothetical protein
MKRAPSGTVVVGLASLVALQLGGAARAEEPRWQFEALPYAWLPGNFGTLDVKGRSVSFATTVRDGIDLATAGNAMFAAGYFSLSRDRWSAFADAFGGYAEESVVENIPTRFCTVSVKTRAEIRPVFVDFAIGYRLGQWSLPERRRPVSLGVYGGVRYMHFGSHVSTAAGVPGAPGRSSAISSSFDWADPMIGARWEIPALDRLSVEFRGDIGGFGASSELVWSLLGGVRYWLAWTPFSTRPWLGAGYRAVAFDRDFGAGDNIDMQFRGPYGGVGLLF